MSFTIFFSQNQSVFFFKVQNNCKKSPTQDHQSDFQDNKNIMSLHSIYLNSMLSEYNLFLLEFLAILQNSLKLI